MPENLQIRSLNDDGTEYLSDAEHAEYVPGTAGLLFIHCVELVCEDGDTEEECFAWRISHKPTGYSLSGKWLFWNPQIAIHAARDFWTSLNSHENELLSGDDAEAIGSLMYDSDFRLKAAALVCDADVEVIVGE